MVFKAKSLNAFMKNRLAVFGACLFIALVLVAVLAPVIAPHDPYEQDVLRKLNGPSFNHLLGLDQYGRDIFSRLLYGTQVSLLVGVTSVVVGLVIGAPLGIVAGYLGGRIESVVMRAMDIMLAFPGIIIGIMLVAIFGSGLGNLVLAIGLSMVPNFARLAHGPTLALREREYVQSGIAIGANDRQIMVRHIWPNIRSELLVVGSLYTATAIRMEANLSFIGLGVAAPTPTWGQMIREGMMTLTISPWYALAPGIAIFLAVLAFNLLGDGLRDAFDPRSANKGR